MTDSPVAQARRRLRGTVSVEHIGASEDYKSPFEKFGVTAEAIVFGARQPISAANHEWSRSAYPYRD